MAVAQLVEETASISEFSGLKLAVADTGWTLRRKKEKAIDTDENYTSGSSWYECSYIEV